MDNPIRVIVVDDHVMIRRGLTALLEQHADIHVVAEAGSGEVAVQLCREACPDVVLVDIRMPGMDGISTIEAIGEQCPAARCIALTSYTEENNVQAAVEAGAMGYLLKTVSGEELATAVRRAHAGSSTLSPEAQHMLVEAVSRGPVPGADLTEREREVLREMIEGLSNPEIAKKLFISPSTVKNHVSAILMKLNANSRTHAVALAMEHKLLKKD